MSEQSRTDNLRKLYREYNLGEGDYFKHKHYVIITRQGIEKIQAKESISVQYETVKCEKDFCVVKAYAVKDKVVVQTYGSALYGEGSFREVGGKNKWVDSGTTNSWYVMEIAEKRALSRAVLKITGLYAEGAYGEDESIDFTPNSDKVVESANNAVEVALKKVKK